MKSQRLRENAAIKIEGLPDEQIKIKNMNRTFLRSGYKPKIQPSKTRTQQLREELSRKKREYSYEPLQQMKTCARVASRINHRNLNDVTLRKTSFTRNETCIELPFQGHQIFIVLGVQAEGSQNIRGMENKHKEQRQKGSDIRTAVCGNDMQIPNVFDMSQKPFTVIPILI
jgi:hypothetical protein